MNENKLKIQIWDTAGQERYRSITSAYYKGAKGTFVVYDITKKSSFENIEKWIKEVKVMGDSDISIILVGNKTDLNEKREVSYEEGLKKSQELRVDFLETSAKTSSNIESLFELVSNNVVEKILKKQIENDLLVDDLVIKDSGIKINNPAEENTEKGNKKCC